ncbi:phosphatidylglycerophosphatase A family protein [Denitromonas iodatirespirans]|uniref:Phosphatidylglycerophosphatase A n=1 Tax=Denitromonas iodatirespirans TaxID=2795389 RepID=A0A944DBA9_DENI1|nr:phosphatidylglycerophosphatase A [Denitromonas iodatirespirans]MBT0963155.1 phosphatidylglycerophosphatase A [Denitromonas iodatirespirans]
MRPTVQFLFAHPAHFIALGLGSGLSPKAPGTAGTLAAWLLFPVLHAPLGDAAFLVFLLTAFVFGIVAADRTGRALGVSDHGAIVWDEMVPFWLVLLFTPDTLAWQLAAFVLFRLFDIVKPQPIKWADSKVKGGFGVMLDDVIAAGYTLLVLAIAARLLDH